MQKNTAQRGLAGLFLAGVAVAQDATPLEPAVKVEADGAVIDTVAGIGHAGPLLHDLDGDGKPELLVSDFRGGIRRFVDEGERGTPRWVEKEPLSAAGKPIRIHNW
ncbi:MAG TPA: hypothetical protein VK081_05860 [Planctomycetota bacterium]|nr:hypothetical protein [Planctomycetota bacterium]